MMGTGDGRTARALLAWCCVLLVSCVSETGRRESRLTELSSSPGAAAVLSDYSSTEIALFSPAGDVLHSRWLHSGTTLPGLVATLSGDVVFPTVAVPGSLMLIDRFRTDVVSRFSMPDGVLVGQARTQDTVGYSSNPHDVAPMAHGELAWVSRHEPNLAARGDGELGNDLWEMRLDTMVPTGRVITLNRWNVRTEGATVYARPSRLVALGSLVVVPLVRLDADFRGSAPGVVLLVDGERGAVLHDLELSDLRNCGHVVPVVGEPRRVLVSCAGFSFPYGDVEATRSTAGVAALEVREGQLRVVWIWKPTGRSPTQVVQSLGGDSFAGVALGRAAEGIGDVLFEVNGRTGLTAPVHRAQGAFVLGTPWWDAQASRLWVPDAIVGIVHYARGPAGWSLEQTVRLGGLPVRHVHSLK